MNKAIGVYIHVPFCAQKCPYCDFYSMRGDEACKERYTQAVLRAVKCYPQPLVADTVYFGGGTPTLLGADRLLQILESIPRCENAEVTLEANPATVTESVLQRLAAGGFTRISLGVQSTNDKLLQTLGRLHSSADAADSILAASRAGFAHISADLMLCVPGQTQVDVLADIDRLSALPLDHISAYLLKIEEGTPFFGRFEEWEETPAADCYLSDVRRLGEQGYIQYEISNFARNMQGQSRHNRKYWECADYLGIGPSAHSMINGRRFYFERDLQAFVQSENVWQDTVDDGVGGTVEEQVMLGLRLTDGIALSLLSGHQRTIAERFAAQGLAHIRNERLSLTTEGFLLSNHILAQLL